MITFARRMLDKALSTATVVGVTSLVACPSSASAFTEPGITGNWADFANCPVSVLMLLPPPVKCEHSITTGGVVQIGHSSVPISIPGDTFDLGISLPPPEGIGVTVVPPRGILNGPAQPVPGGLLGAIGDTQLVGVSAKLEWAVSKMPGAAFGVAAECSASPLITFNLCDVLNTKRGIATTLSVKIHLISPFLGSACSIGSSAHPIVIPLTTGATNPPLPAHSIYGQAPEFLRAIPPSGTREQAFGLKLVNNSFSVPAASGCSTSNGNLIDTSINQKLGLPSPPGQNAIMIEADGEQADPSAVLAHGWTGE